MKCLSVAQPWATLIASGAQRIKTHPHNPQYRGPIAIHAGVTWPNSSTLALLRTPAIREALAAMGLLNGTINDLIAALPMGKIVAVADLVDVVRITADNVPGEPERSFGNYEVGRYAWHLENVCALQRPIPARGALGLWTPDPFLAEMITAAQKDPSFDYIWPKIDWHCQDCGKLQFSTLGRAPWAGGDAEGCDCLAGPTMTMVVKCGTCGQDLEGGDNLCEHMPQVAPPGQVMAP